MYDYGIRNALSGHRVRYRPGEVNHCPGCDKQAWIIGRMSAECAHCGTAIPYTGSAGIGSGLVRRAA